MSQKHISSPELYKHYYLSQAQQKGGNPYFAGRLFQRGYGQRGRGIGSFLGGMVRRALPFLASAAKHIGKAVLKTGANVLSDAVAGQNMHNSLQSRFSETGQELKRDAVNRLRNSLTSQTGSGRKRRRAQPSKRRPQKKRKQGNKGKQKKRKTTPSSSKPIKRKKKGKAVRSRKTTKPRTMALIHPRSQECMVEELDLFTISPTQNSILKKFDVEYQPISSPSPTSSTPI